MQLIPAIADTVAELHVFSRSNCWTFPYRFKGDYTEEQKSNWANNGELEYHRSFDRMLTISGPHSLSSTVEELKAYRQQLQQEEEYRFKWFISSSPGQKQMLELAKAHLEAQIPESKQDLRDLAMPSYAIGCRRITPSDTYFATLARDHVHYHRERLDHVEPGTVVLQGGQRIEDLDILIAATGYDTTFHPSYEVVGLNGVSLRDLWTGKGRHAQAFHGHSVHNFPNFFMVGGPSTPWGQGTIIGVAQAAIAYMLTLIRGMIDNGVRSVHPRKDKQDEFNEFTQKFLKQTVWCDRCVFAWRLETRTPIKLTLRPFPENPIKHQQNAILKLHLLVQRSRNWRRTRNLARPSKFIPQSRLDRPVGRLRNRLGGQFGKAPCFGTD